MSFTDLIYGIIFSPAQTLRTISDNKPWAYGIVVFLVVMTFTMIVNRGIYVMEPVEQVLSIPSGFLWLGALIGIIFSLILLFIMAGLYSLLGEIIYQSGNGSGLLASLGFASLPGIFGPPLQYIAILADLNPLSMLISFAITIWLLVLQVIAIREALRLSTGQATFLFIIPLLITIIIVGGILVFALSLAPFYK